MKILLSSKVRMQIVSIANITWLVHRVFKYTNYIVNTVTFQHASRVLGTWRVRIYKVDDTAVPNLTRIARVLFTCKWGLRTITTSADRGADLWHLLRKLSSPRLCGMNALTFVNTPRPPSVPTHTSAHASDIVGTTWSFITNSWWCIIWWELHIAQLI